MLALLLTSQNAETLQASADNLIVVKTFLIILFVLTVLVAAFNLLYYFVSKNSPDLLLNFLIPNFQIESKNVFFTIEDHLGRPLGFTKMTIFKGEKIYRVFYKSSGDFGIYLPHGVYDLTVSKFGFTDSSTDNFRVDGKKIKFDLTLKQTESLEEAPILYRLAVSNFLADLLITAFALVCYFDFYSDLTIVLQVILLALCAGSLYLAHQFFAITRSIQLVNFKNRPIKYKDIEFADRQGEKIESFTTNKLGKLQIALSPGIYKINPEDYSARMIRVNEAGLGHLKIKF